MNRDDSSDSLFVLLSPIESKLEERFRLKTQQPLHGSPLMRAKHAIKRTFSGSSRHDSERKRVKEAQDACIWLRTAGFPQYVQKFEAGEFPMNVTKLQVERDHQFLDSPAIDTLIKRLNVLSQCADILGEVLAKDDDSEDEEAMRALSEQWQFQKKEKRWSRKPIKHHASANVLPSIIATIPDNGPILVSELCSSPTQGHIKTYSFCIGNQSPPTCSSPILVNGLEERLGSLGSLMSKDLLLSQEQGLDRLGSFASGMIDELDNNLMRLRRVEGISLSLPNVCSDSLACIRTSPSDSSRATSVSSAIENGEDDAEMNFFTSEDTCQSPSIHSRGASASGPEGDSLLRVDSVCSSTTWGPSPDSCVWETETESPTLLRPHRRMERHSTMGSTDSGSFLEQVEVLSDGQMPRRPSSEMSIRAKWHSFQRQHSFRHAFKPLRTLIPIEELSVGQITVLRKLSLVKLTALVELNNGKTNVSRILKLRRQKHIEARGKKVFGVPLMVNVQRHGHSLPPLVLQAMEYIKKAELQTIGLFRRTAAKPRVEALKELIEASPDSVDYSEYSGYEIADMLKLYFRELPEPLLTSKLSEALIVTHECIPQQVRLQALQAIMLLLPDANREAFQCLLHFLHQLASWSHIHQMDINNLALCLAPTLFSFSSASRPSPLSRRSSFKRNNSIAPPGGGNTLLTPTGNKELSEHVASSKCLSELIQCHDKLFMVAADMMQTCKFSHLEFGDPVPYQELSGESFGASGYQTYLDDCTATLLKEQKRRFRRWVHCDSFRGVDLAYSKVGDGVPLRLWRGVVEVPAPPNAVLHRLWEERHVWDGRVLKGRQISNLDPQTEVFQYVTPSIPPLAHRDHCILRGWRHDPITDSYVLIATSISHPSATLLGGVRATELAVRHHIECVGDGETRLTIFCRVDIRGRSPDFYNHSYGRYLASSIHTVRDSFKRSLELDYLETPV